MLSIYRIIKRNVHFIFIAMSLIILKNELSKNEISLNENPDYNGFLFAYGARDKDGKYFDLKEKTTLILTINPAGAQKDKKEKTIDYPDNYFGDTDIERHFDDPGSKIAGQLHHLY